MRAKPGSASEADDVQVRFTRAPVDRLFVVCVVACSVAYAGWLLAMRLWPGDPEPDARQSYAGFIPGSSQPPAGGGELFPATAGEYGSSKLGTSHYFGGAMPRPIAEDAVAVPSPELPEPKREPARGPAVAPPSPDPHEAASEPAAKLGRLGLAPRVSRWLLARSAPCGRRLDGTAEW